MLNRGALRTALELLEKAEVDRSIARDLVVAVIRESSYREVSRITGLSTNTLQRWVREAKS